MKAILIIVLFLISNLGLCQSNFSKIDKYSKTVPDSITDYKEIAHYLTDNLETDTEKVRAIYIWITHNIRYDMNRVKVVSYESYHPNKIIKESLSKRKGVCYHYAMLFSAMSEAAGLEMFSIFGYTKDSLNRVSASSHAWNAVKIDSSYYLIDATWSAGYVRNFEYFHKFRDYYFLIPPKQFIKTHIPFDPMWQFIDNPISHKDFKHNNFSKLDSIGTFSFVDSIRQYQRQDELSKLENYKQRIIVNGIENKIIKAEITLLESKIKEQKEINEYNRVVNTLNNGIETYNIYINYRNEDFKKPKLHYDQAKELIEVAYQNICTAKEKFNALSPTQWRLKLLVSNSIRETDKLISALENEKKFIDKYLKNTP